MDRKLCIEGNLNREKRCHTWYHILIDFEVFKFLYIILYCSAVNNSINQS